MKNKKLNLFAFKQDELSRESISSIKAGEPVNGKPPGSSTGNGSGGEVICYYDLDGELLYCTEKDRGDLPPSGTTL